MDKFVKKVEGDFSFAAFSPSFADKFMRMVNDNGADDELASAIAWVMENIPQTSLAAECAQRTPTDIKALIEKGKSGVLSAGNFPLVELHYAAVLEACDRQIHHQRERLGWQWLLRADPGGQGRRGPDLVFGGLLVQK